MNEPDEPNEPNEPDEPDESNEPGKLNEPDEPDNPSPFTPQRRFSYANISERIFDIKGRGEDYKHDYVGKFIKLFIPIDFSNVKTTKLPINDESFYSLIKMREFHTAITGVFVEVVIRRLFCERLKIVFIDTQLEHYISKIQDDQTGNSIVASMRDKEAKLLKKRTKHLSNTAKYKTRDIVDELLLLTSIRLDSKYFQTVTIEVDQITDWMQARPINHLVDDLKKIVARFKNITISNFRHEYNLSYKVDNLGPLLKNFNYKTNEENGAKLSKLGTCDLIIGDMVVDIKVTQKVHNSDMLNVAIQAALFNASNVKKIKRIGIMSILEKQLYIWSIADWSIKDQAELLKTFFYGKSVNVETGEIKLVDLT